MVVRVSSCPVVQGLVGQYRLHRVKRLESLKPKWVWHRNQLANFPSRQKNSASQAMHGDTNRFPCQPSQCRIRSVWLSQTAALPPVQSAVLTLLQHREIFDSIQPC
jgi:hypothetical protein